WWQEESLRGEFLRALRNHAIDGGIDWRHHLPARPLPDSLAQELAADSKHARERVLAQATLLGVDLLSGEEPQA
ncbi:MAG TPA: hypothetical protein VMF30_00925, partial [Pirellulales bacterium]|nr:hypothetical protein [Pirellulales bacterium]